jgi:hypothetical protein
VGVDHTECAIAGYVCNGTVCGYLPVVTFENVVQFAMVAFAIFVIRQAYLWIRDIRRAVNRVTSVS